MPSTLHLAPIGAGKSEFIVDRLIEFAARRSPNLPKIWVLLATRHQVFNCRQQLVQRNPDMPSFFNIEFLDFYSLNTVLLNRAGAPARRIERATQQALARGLALQLNQNQELVHFGRIAHTRGFISLLTDVINELKQNGVDNDAFERAVRSDKDRDIAAIYRLYQDALRENELVDPEGEGWLALATLRKQGAIVADVDLLLVDGFDQFTRIQAQLLAELSRNIPNTDITLTVPPGRASELLRRSALTEDRLRMAYREAGESLEARQLRQASGNRHPDLESLNQAIFTGRAAGESSDALKLIAMPTLAEETKAMLRAVKRQLLDGVAAEDILIVLRDWQRYASYFRATQAEYDLPLLLRHQPPLDAIPVIAVLIDTLELAPHFRRANVLDALQSPYIDSALDTEEIDLLERLSKEAQFTRGTIDDWLQMIQLASQRRPDDERDRSPVAPEQASVLARKLETFLIGVTPPATGDVRRFVDWLDGLIGDDQQHDPESARDYVRTEFTLNIASNIAPDNANEDEIPLRDVCAIDDLRRIMREQLKTDFLLRSRFGQGGFTRWNDFWQELKDALGREIEARHDPSRDHQVWVATAAEARGLPHPHVYILGLSEGVFPADVAEDPIYLDVERARLQNAGVPLQLSAERSDDRGLFYELVGLPRSSLTLSRPTVQDGKLWIESHLWRSVLQVFPRQPIVNMSIGQLVSPEEAASSAELMLSAADQLREANGYGRVEISRLDKRLRNHHAYAPHWLRILRGQRIESGRLSAAPHDQFSGHLSHPALQAEAARRLDPQRSFSASRLKDYGLCGFRYFAKRMLRLDETIEPEAGLDLRQLGSLNHKILEDTYRTIRSLGIRIHEENLERALAIFERVAKDILESAPETFVFRATATWMAEQELLFRRLRAVIVKDFSADSPLNAFGGDRHVQAVERDFSDIEVALPSHEEPLRLHGFIDRIDEVDGRLLVVDYKTGSTKINRDEMESGRDFQMMAYALAMMKGAESDSTQSELAGGMFWHIRDLKASGKFDATDEDDIAALNSALAHVSENLRRGRLGRFPVQPTALEAGKCSRYCEFARLCRVNLTNRHKRSKD